MDTQLSSKHPAPDEMYENSPEQRNADLELSTVNVNVYESMRIDANKDEHTYGVANVDAEKVRTGPEVTLSRTALIVLVVSAVILSAVISTVSAVVAYNMTNGKVIQMDQESTANTRRLENLESVMQAVQQKQNTSDIALLGNGERLEALENKVDVVQNKLTILDTLVHDPVLFTARLTSDMNPAIGATIVFGTVIQNVGNGYNASTGVFTASINGTYLFSVQMCINTENVISYAVMANERELSLAEHGDAIDDVCSATTALGILTEGETVFVRCLDKDLNAGNNILEANDPTRYWTMFTGVIINTSVEGGEN